MESFSFDLMIGMLRKGQTGDQILQILDVVAPQAVPAIVEEQEEVVMNPEFATI